MNGNVGDTQSFHLPHQVVPERCSDVSKLPIKLKPLPFYENLSEILSPVVLSELVGILCCLGKTHAYYVECIC